MLISKMGKRLMAFVIAMAFVLSGLTYLPKTANAEGAVPTVDVLGAKLRLDKEGVDNNGTQSMKLAVEIKNADSASNCAIELNVGGRVRTITTADVPEGSQDKIQSKSLYSKNEADNSVVYAVTITGIPQDAFDTDIKVKGMAEYNKDTSTSTAESTQESKSVDGIVKSLQEKYSYLGIAMYDGTLYKNYGETALTANDIGANGNITLAESTVDKTDYITYNEDGTMSVEDKRTDDSTTEIHVKLPFTVKPGQKVNVSIAGPQWGTSDFRIWTVPKDAKYSGDYVENNNITLNPKINDDNSFGGTASVVCKKGDCNYLTLKPQAGIKITGLIISSIDVEVEALPEPTPRPEPKDIDIKFSAYTAHPANGVWWYEDSKNNEYMPDGSVKFHVGGGRGVAFYVNEDKTPIRIGDYSKAVVVCSADVDDEPVGLGLITDPDLKFDDNNVYDSQNSKRTGAANTESTFEIDIDKDVNNKNADVYGVLVSDRWKDGANITVKSIKLFKKEVSTATPTPKPDPRPDLTVAKTTASIKVDAEIDEAWKSAETLSIPNSAQAVTTDTSATAKLLWNDKYLYILADVKDSNIDYSASKADDYKRDGVEILFDEDCSLENNYNENLDAFQYRYTGFEADDPTDTFVNNTGKIAKNKYRGMKTAYKITDTGYTVEAAIPFASSPIIGKKMGFELTIMDCADGNRKNELWLIGTGKGNLWMDPSILGIIQLAE